MTETVGTRKVGTKGQVVIDKSIRDELGIEPGFVAVQRRVGDHVEIRFYPAEHERSLRGVLADAVTRPVDPGEDWSELRRRGWAAAARERAAEGEG